jgi:hypothetical protein
MPVRSPISVNMDMQDFVTCQSALPHPPALDMPGGLQYREAPPEPGP